MERIEDFWMSSSSALNIMSGISYFKSLFHHLPGRNIGYSEFRMLFF
jgi:hypothetical protein